MPDTYFLLLSTTEKHTGRQTGSGNVYTNKTRAFLRKMYPSLSLPHSLAMRRW